MRRGANLDDVGLRNEAAGGVPRIAERISDDHPDEATAAVKRGLEVLKDYVGYRIRAEHLIRRVGRPPRGT